MSDNHYLLQTGSLGKPSISEECARDDQGVHISNKNSKYAELTGLYWIWKNQKAQYIGMLQYKRRFAKEYSLSLFKRKLTFSYHILSSSNILHYLKKYDAIVAEEKLGEKTVDYQFRTSGFSYRGEYPGIILDAVYEVIKKEFPIYYDTFRCVMSGNIINPHNMLVAKYEVFEAYCEFLFPILDKLDKYVPVGFNNVHYNRMYGWLAERLFRVFLQFNNVVYKSFPVVDIEHMTLSMKDRLNDFLKRCARKVNKK